MEIFAMHKGQIKWLALGVVGVLAFAGCVAQDGDEGTGSDVGGADVALDPVAGEVSVKLAIDKTTVTSSERVMVRVTLKNESIIRCASCLGMLPTAKSKKTSLR